MDTEKLKEVLLELQNQLDDLTELQLGQNISFNDHIKQLNQDMYSLYEQILSINPPQDIKKILEDKQIKYDILNGLTDKASENVRKAFDERFTHISKNLEKINQLF